ncbi:hypothetical protein Q1695_012285 [Nippostrongylus brasiliensis]|nr:hypothetical protein Q1695_012285 [Nippostrongylus brasiliensis]
MDDWDLIDEVDVIALWPSEHKKNVESAKWQERKEALEVLVQLMEKNPRLASATMTIYGEVMDNLKKIIIHDSNINVVIAALKVVAKIASGLRNRFACFVPMIWPVMLDKAKDKKATVRVALGEALDAVSETCGAERLAKDLCEHLAKPSPQSKQCLCEFITRYFVRQTNVSLEFAKAVLPTVVKLASDSDPSVRDAACSCLGSARRLMAKGLDGFLVPIISEKAKLEKIEEYCKEATKLHEEFLASRPQRASTADVASSDIAESSAEVGTLPEQSMHVDPWTVMEPTDVMGKIRKDFDEMLASKKWQERKDAVDSLLSIMECSPRVEMSPELQAVISTLLKVLEKDVNINVTSVCAKVIAKMALSMRTDFAGMVPKLMPIAFDKLKEKKAVLRNELVDLCDAAATTISFENYADAVCGGLTKPNPQTRAQTALFIGRLLSRHDPTTVPVGGVKQIAPDLIKCSSDADAEVREAAFRAMAAVLRCVGEPAAKRLFGELWEDKIKMAKITESFEKIREEYGDKAAPEIVRLHSKVAKQTPSQPSSENARVTSAVQPARKVPPVARPSARPSTAGARPAAVDERLILLVSRPPLSTRPVQPSMCRPSPAPAKPAPRTVPYRAPVKVPCRPNVVRITNQPAEQTKPVSVNNNGLVLNGGTDTIQALPSGAVKPKSNLPRPTSGLRPPTTVTRTSGGVLKLSRPSSPSK